MSGCKSRHRLHLAAPAKRQLFPCRTEVLTASGPHTPGFCHGTSPGCLIQCKQIFGSQAHRPVHALTADGLGTSQTVLQQMSSPICSKADFFSPELVLGPAVLCRLLHSRQVLSHHCSSLEQGFTFSYTPLCTAQTPPFLQSICISQPCERDRCHHPQSHSSKEATSIDISRLKTLEDVMV